MIRETGKTAEEEVMGYVRGERRVNWFDEDCRSTAIVRRRCRKVWMEDKKNKDKHVEYMSATNTAFRVNKLEKRLDLMKRYDRWNRTAKMDK